MWSFDVDAFLRWLWSIVAKSLLLLFLTPFLIMTGAGAFALGASQGGRFVGWIAVGFFVVGIAAVLGHWTAYPHSNSDL